MTQHDQQRTLDFTTERSPSPRATETNRAPSSIVDRLAGGPVPERVNNTSERSVTGALGDIATRLGAGALDSTKTAESPALADAGSTEVPRLDIEGLTAQEARKAIADYLTSTFNTISTTTQAMMNELLATLRKEEEKGWPNESASTLLENMKTTLQKQDIRLVDGSDSTKLIIGKADDNESQADANVRSLLDDLSEMSEKTRQAGGTIEALERAIAAIKGRSQNDADYEATFNDVKEKYGNLQNALQVRSTTGKDARNRVAELRSQPRTDWSF